MCPEPFKRIVVKSIPGGPNYRLPQRRRFRGRHLFLILVICGLLLGAYKVYLPDILALQQRLTCAKPVTPAAESAPEASAAPASPPAPIPSAPPSPALTAKAEGMEKFEIRHHIVRPGESLAQVVESAGLPSVYAQQWEKACKSGMLSNLKEDDELIFFINRSDGQPVKMLYSSNEGPGYMLRKTADGWDCPLETTQKGPVATARGTYAENFFDSCISAGLPAAIIPALAELFAYDVDFMSDLKDGDSFAVYYQGVETDQYRILAAEMTVGGKVFQAFGFQVPDGSWEYFDAKGASLKRAFLRSPISYRRLLSPSTYKNVKPVLKIYRPHLGIDYAAPKGTPVSALGDGVVSSVNKKGKNAVSIEIRHRGGYRSVYGHLSSYSRGLKHGSFVSLGEVIGSVGAGNSGKPYLDFHFYKDGKPINFQAVEFPRIKSIPKVVRPEFEKTRDSYSAAMLGKSSQNQDPAASGRE